MPRVQGNGALLESNPDENKRIRFEKAAAVVEGWLDRQGATCHPETRRGRFEHFMRIPENYFSKARANVACKQQIVVLAAVPRPTVSSSCNDDGIN
jgi:hypothetical protein